MPIRVMRTHPILLCFLFCSVIFDVIFFDVVYMNPYRLLRIRKSDGLIFFTNPCAELSDLREVFLVFQYLYAFIKTNELSDSRKRIHAMIDHIINRVL